MNKIGNKSLDLKSQKIVNKNYNPQRINIHINGGIIQSTLSSQELLYIFNMIFGDNGVKHEYLITRNDTKVDPAAGKTLLQG
mgnify:CR=1 FL=1